MPGPPSVIEDSLLVGFVGRKEQTGHPSQKPVKVIEPLLKMTTKEGDLVLDPMSGSGTTAEAARRLGRHAIICDHSEEYTQIAEKRLGVRRIKLPQDLWSSLTDCAQSLPHDWQIVQQPIRYPIENSDVDSSKKHQMAFFENHENGNSGSRTKQEQSARHRSRTSLR